MSPERIPFLILGGGAAAFSAATRANDLGVETVMINAGLPIGGTCVNVGCVPSKHLLEAARATHAARHPTAPGLTVGSVEVDYGAMKAARDRLVEGLRGSNYQDVLASLDHVRLVEGHGRFVDPHTVEVDGDPYVADQILVAVGSRARALPVPGGDHPRVLDNRAALELQELPSRLVVVGGGPQGLEWAQAFARLGSEVTVLVFLPQVLGPLDADVAAVVQDALVAEGIDVRTGAKVTGIEEASGGDLVVVWQDAGGEHRSTASHVLKAVGVDGNADRIDAERAGLAPERRGFLSVDDRLATTVPHIFAAGDIVGRYMLEHAAGKEGKVAADNALTGGDLRVDYPSMPAAVFTDPEVAWVGPTERDYMDAHGTCRCRAVRFDHVPRAMATGRTRGIARLTVDHRTEKVVGAQMVGPHAGDAIHEIVVAIRAGLTVDELIDTVHAFPTYSEAFKTAALAFRRDVSVMACCIG
jgi:mercuric reductase